MPISDGNLDEPRYRAEFLEHVAVAIESFPGQPRPAVVWQTAIGCCLAQAEDGFVTFTCYAGSPGRRGDVLVDQVEVPMWVVRMLAVPRG